MVAGILPNREPGTQNRRSPSGTAIVLVPYEERDVPGGGAVPAHVGFFYHEGVKIAGRSRVASTSLVVTCPGYVVCVMG